MSHYLLLLHEPPDSFDNLSPEEIQQAIARYSAWREGIASKGRLAGGNKLKDEGGRSLSQTNGSVRVVDGPFAEAKEVIGGYFLIEADSYDEAVEMSRTCPHLEFGGRIELREVDPVHG